MTKFKSLLAVTCLASLVLAFSACKKEGAVTISDEKQLKQAAYADETTTGSFTFTATDDWTASVKETTTTKKSSVSWVKLLCNGAETYSGSKGTYTIVVSLEINYTGALRTADVEIASGNDKIGIVVTQQGTTKDGEIPEEPNGDEFVINATNVINSSSKITIVKAFVNKSDWEFYEIATATYENNGFNLKFPAHLPDDYLSNITQTEFFPPNVISDPNAKLENVRIYAYNSTGNRIGEIYPVGNIYDSWCEHVYVDRDVTANGNFEDIVYDCNLKKGWNALYAIGKTDEFLWTTHKPSDIIFEWYYSEYGK